MQRIVPKYYGISFGISSSLFPFGQKKSHSSWARVSKQYGRDIQSTATSVNYTTYLLRVVLRRNE